jgi:hypothetical protein
MHPTFANFDGRPAADQPSGYNSDLVGVLSLPEGHPSLKTMHSGAPLELGQQCLQLVEGRELRVVSPEQDLDVIIRKLIDDGSPAEIKERFLRLDHLFAVSEQCLRGLFAERLGALSMSEFGMLSISAYRLLREQPALAGTAVMEQFNFDLQTSYTERELRNQLISHSATVEILVRTLASGGLVGTSVKLLEHIEKIGVVNRERMRSLVRDQLVSHPLDYLIKVGEGLEVLVFNRPEAMRLDVCHVLFGCLASLKEEALDQEGRKQTGAAAWSV